MESGLDDLGARPGVDVFAVFLGFVSDSVFSFDFSFDFNFDFD
jgi:hypothetical protein